MTPVSLDVDFPAYPDRPNLPAAVQAERDRLERDPVPLRKGSAVQSNAVRYPR